MEVSMKSRLSPLFLISILAISAGTISAQDDETRSATGLPTKIGENTTRGSKMNVSGRIKLETAETVKPAPIITVHVMFGGVTIQKAVANDAGVFLIQGVPRDAVSIMVEVNGNEVIRQPIPNSTIGNQKIDFTIPWPLQRSQDRPGVVNVGNRFNRSAENEKLFQSALNSSKNGETQKAVEAFNKLLEADSKDFVAWTELGTVYFRANDLSNAEACYFKAIELKKDYFAALLNLGKLYLERKQPDEAILVLSNAVASTPSSADARHSLGEAYLLAKKGSLAVAQLNEAIRLAPDEKAEVHLRLASLYDAAGMKSKASAQYVMFLKKRPDFSGKKQLEKYIADHPPDK